jgi:hypothetical protein
MKINVKGTCRNVVVPCCWTCGVACLMVLTNSLYIWVLTFEAFSV